MMMNSWLAPALRRFVGTAVMLLAAGDSLSRVGDVRPDLPTADVDRVVVRNPEGAEHEVREPAEVARIVAFVQARPAGWKEVRPITSFPDGSHASFYKGTELRGWIFFTTHHLVAPADVGTAVYPLDRSEHARLRRLIDR